MMDFCMEFQQFSIHEEQKHRRSATQAGEWDDCPYTRSLRSRRAGLTVTPPLRGYESIKPCRGGRD